MTCTYVRTYTLMDAWAQTFVGTSSPCAVDDCHAEIEPGEVCYYVTQLDRDENGREQPVCWRHVHPDEGPR